MFEEVAVYKPATSKPANRQVQCSVTGDDADEKRFKRPMAIRMNQS
jgi:hypothetical protein